MEGLIGKEKAIEILNTMANIQVNETARLYLCAICGEPYADKVNESDQMYQALVMGIEALGGTFKDTGV